MTYYKTLVWNVERDSRKIFRRGDTLKRTDRKIVIDSPYIKVEDAALKNNIRVQELELGDGVEEIGIGSFQGCTRLRTCYCRNVRIIRRAAFENCVNLRGIDLSDEMEYIGKGVFSRCKRLRNITFPENSRITEIPAEAFAECRELNNVQLSEQIRVIGEKAFYKCTELKEIVLPGNLVDIRREAFCENGMEEIILPESLLKIGDSAFLKCRNLCNIQIPESVTRIGKWAFHGCDNLGTLVIPGNPRLIGDWFINRKTTVRCRKGSYVERYCVKNGFRVEYM